MTLGKEEHMINKKRIRLALGALLMAFQPIHAQEISQETQAVQKEEQVYLEETFEKGEMPANWNLKGSASIGSDGTNKYLQLNKNSMITIPMPEGVGDYTMEADVTFNNVANDMRWLSMMFRVQKDTNKYYQMAVRQNAAAPATASNGGVEFAKWEGNWFLPATASYKEAFALGKSYHLKATINGDRVKMWVNDEEMIFSDQATVLKNGDLGLQMNDGQARFDNIKVTLQPDALDGIIKSSANYAKAKTLNANLTAAPTAIKMNVQNLDDINASIQDSVTSSLMFQARLQNGEIMLGNEKGMISSMNNMMKLAYGKILLLMEVNDLATAQAMASYIKQDQGIEDLMIVSNNGEILQYLKENTKNVRFAYRPNIENVNVSDVGNIVQQSNAYWSNVVILPANGVSKDVVEQIQRHLKSVWLIADKSPTQLSHAILSGANGILSEDMNALTQASAIFDGKTLTRRSFIIGHRGSGNADIAPENTMTAVKRVVEEYGAQMFENDVYLTKDQEVIVLHDSTFARTTDIETNQAIDESYFVNGVTRANCRPKDLPLAEIKKLNVDISKNPDDLNIKHEVPTLQEQLDYIKNRDVMLFLELKDASEGIEAATLNLIKANGVENKVGLITFNTKSIPIVQHLQNTYAIGNLNGVGSVPNDDTKIMDYVRSANNMATSLYATYNPSYPNAANQAFLDNLNARGFTQWPWTYNNHDAFMQAIDQGISGLTTDFSQWAKDFIFTLQTDRSNYEMEIGDTLQLEGYGLTNMKEKKVLATIPIRIAGNNVEIHNGKLYAAASGGADFILKTTVQFDTATYQIYSDIIHVNVKGADTTALQDEIAKAISLDSNEFTTDSYNILQDVLDESESMLHLGTLTNDDCLKQIEKLSNAQKQLVKCANKEQLTRIENSIKEYQATDASHYTKDSWQAYASISEELITAYANTNNFAVDTCDQLLDKYLLRKFQLVSMNSDQQIRQLQVNDINIAVEGYFDGYDIQLANITNARLEEAVKRDLRTYTIQTAFSVNGKMIKEKSGHDTWKLRITLPDRLRNKGAKLCYQNEDGVLKEAIAIENNGQLITEIVSSHFGTYVLTTPKKEGQIIGQPALINTSVVNTTSEIPTGDTFNLNLYIVGLFVGAAILRTKKKYLRK